jgi:hypothetical protein
MPSPKSISSKTKGATITKQGHTTSGKFGTAITKKASHNTRVVGPKG